jgi:hypothetical protein
MALLAQELSFKYSSPPTCVNQRLLDLLLSLLPVPLQPSVNGFTEVERNLRPSPPERTENEVDCGQSHNHVVAEEKPVQEKDDEANRDDAENHAGNEREKKQQYRHPERNSWLWSAEFRTPAFRTDASPPRIDMQSRAEFDIITSAAEIAE